MKGAGFPAQKNQDFGPHTPMCHGVPLAYGLESLHGHGCRCPEPRDVRHVLPRCPEPRECKNVLPRCPEPRECKNVLPRCPEPRECKKVLRRIGLR